MRLQILELPARRLGPAEETPYLLVLTGVTKPETVTQYEPKELERLTGARGLLVFQSDIEVGPPPPDPVWEGPDKWITGAITPPLDKGGFPKAGPPNGR